MMTPMAPSSETPHGHSPHTEVPHPQPVNPHLRETPDWYADGARNIWLPYTQMKTTPAPLPAVATHGSRIRLADGRELIDGIASWWTACHGYNHPAIADAVRTQLDAMPHVMLGGLVHEPALRLAKRLAGLLPEDLDRVFFTESGSVSVEVAMKVAVQYHRNRGQADKNHFVSFLGGYHGDTFAAMSVADPEEGMHSLFTGVLRQEHVVPVPRTKVECADFAAFLMRERHRLAGVLIEPLVQGAGGMVFHDGETLRAIRDACSAADVLLIADEIFVGFGRTGSLFACPSVGVTPDILTLSKALTGGTCPLAATVVRESIFEAFYSDEIEHALMHGPTYMGHAMGCAAALASLDLFESEPRVAQARAMEGALKDGLLPLAALEGVRDVRIRGAIGVVQLEDIGDVERWKEKFLDEGVWVRPFRDIVYVTPALNIDSDDLGTLLQAIRRVCHDLARPAAR